MNEAQRNYRLVMRLRLAIVRAVCWMLLPRNVWVGKHFGAYTCRWSVHLGKLDNRGVLQGLSDRDAGAIEASHGIGKP